MNSKPTKFDALRELVVGGFGYDSETDTVEFSPNNKGPNPTEKEIDAKLAEMISEWESNDYKNKRKEEYPSIEELVVALYDTDDKSAIEAKRAEVKKKYPKP